MGRTKTEVRDKLRELHAQVDSGVRPRRHYTVGDALDDWQAHGLDGLAPSTMTLYRDTIAKALREELGSVKLTALTAGAVQKALFVAQVALMGLEMTGLARPNAPLVWADPADYQSELAAAVDTLATAGITTRIYNHQLCVLDRHLWPYAVRSISDWKNDYLDICRSCTVRDACGGVFTTSGNRLSQHLHPIP